VSSKREAELRKVKRELEDTQAQRDSQMAALRKKSQEAVNELNEQIDQLQKAKLKYSRISVLCNIGTYRPNYIYSVARHRGIGRREPRRPPVEFT